MEETPKTIESGRGLPFGEWLVDKNQLTHRQLHEVLSEQQQNGGHRKLLDMSQWHRW